jgi:nucleoside-diphosphate-sugar epimerase
MHILVTGGLGEIGHPTVGWLTERGHDVRVLDLNSVDAMPFEPLPEVDYRQGDVTDFEALGAHMDGIEGVVHLAAYRHPSMAPEHRMFHVNVGGTFNVFRAAADAGIGRVVCASSINVLGYNFGVSFVPNQVRYFPIDEAHPIRTTDPYSFSKQMIEEIGAYFWRREAITSLFLRFPAVYDLSAPGPSILKSFVIECHRQTAALLALPEPERSARVRDIVERFEAKAAAREWEAQFDLSFPDAYVMFGRSNFWTSLDVRDAAQAIEKGLLAAYAGSPAVYVTDPHNFVGLPSRELAAVFFPEVTTWKRPIEGTASLVSIERAQELIGFEPRHHFRHT